MNRENILKKIELIEANKEFQRSKLSDENSFFIRCIKAKVCCKCGDNIKHPLLSEAMCEHCYVTTRGRKPGDVPNEKVITVILLVIGAIFAAVVFGWI